MADGGFPNKNRAINAYDTYGDAMRPYIAQVLERAHGPDWVRLRLLTDDLLKNDERRYGEVERALRSKKPLLEILDRGDVPNLVNGDLANFPNLSRNDARSLFTIRNLRNEIVHLGSGDCPAEDADAIASLCTRALERCGLSDVAENIRRISSAATPDAQATPEADLREQRERREWDKARFASKPRKELAQWEQERLAEIEWEEEWERREQERLAQLEREQQQEREERQRQERERQDRLARQERERLERERVEIAAFDGDINGLRRWFDADEGRRQRHWSAHEALVRRERKRKREEQDRLAHQKREREERQRYERERREPELRERERAEITAFGDDIAGLRRWFTANTRRVQRHPSAYETLVQREQQLAAQRRQEREQKQHHRPPDAVDSKSRTGDAPQQREREERVRRDRHGPELKENDWQRLERERAEIAAFGDDIAGLRRWFAANTRRVQRHSSAYKTLVQREQQRAAQRLRERERAALSAFGDDIDGLRRWFDMDEGRRQRHTSEYDALEQREQDQHRWPPGPVDSKSRTGNAPPERGRSLLSRIFRR